MTLTDPSEIVRHRVELHPKQLEAFRALSDPTIREVTLRKGRRAGGTFVTALAATGFAIEHPKSPYANGKPTQIAFFGPLYENATKLWREIRDSFGDTLEDSRESKLDLVWHGGARGKCYSGEKMGAVLGEGLDIAIVDEASNFPGQLIRSHIVPSLTDRKGRLWMPSSPRHGKNNHFAQRCLKAEAGLIEGVRGFHFTSRDNPRIDPKWLEDMRNDPDMDEMTFKEEFEAEIVDTSSAWLDPSQIQRIPTAMIPGNTFNTLHGDFAFADPEPGAIDRTTRRRKDANCLAPISQDVLGNCYLRLGGFYKKFADQDEVFENAGRLIQRYNMQRFCFEREVNVHGSTQDSIGRLWHHFREARRLPFVVLVRPHRGSRWKTPQIRAWSTLPARGKFFIETSDEEENVLDVPLTKEMIEYSETAAAQDKVHDDVIVAVSDVKQPEIDQSRSELEVREASREWSPYFDRNQSDDDYHYISRRSVV